MIKREAKSSILFRHWLMANPFFGTAAFEMKDSRGKDSIPWREIKMRQLDYGMAIKKGEKGVLIRTLGGNGEPDYIFMKQSHAFVVIKFPSCMCVIDVQDLYNNIPVLLDGQQGALSCDRARKISTKVIELKGK